ncbi:MAG: hypothetical protein WA633_07280 [Stellaceae bacterium]
MKIPHKRLKRRKPLVDVELDFFRQPRATRVEKKLTLRNEAVIGIELVGIARQIRVVPDSLRRVLLTTSF